MLMQSTAEVRSNMALHQEYSTYVDPDSTAEHMWQRMWCYSGGIEPVGSQ